MATSRTPLRIAAERDYALAPLELGSAVSLFVARAPSLELTAANEAVVSEICRRLDGLPLALELAAARLRLLTPDALLERLEHALDLLASGSRDTPGRQQTLRATIEWSHSLLDEQEQRLFRRLAVFAGGCTFEDVEAVCADPGTGCLDELESLVDKALVQFDGPGGRLRMLETIREFAGERLAAAGEGDEIAAQARTALPDVARAVRDGVEGDTRSRRSSAESRRRPISRPLSTRSSGLPRAGDRDACERGLLMCDHLWMYWHVRGKNLTAWDAGQVVPRRGHRADPHRRPRGRAAHGVARLVDGRPDRAREGGVGRGVRDRRRRRRVRASFASRPSAGHVRVAGLRPGGRPPLGDGSASSSADSTGSTSRSRSAWSSKGCSTPPPAIRPKPSRGSRRRSRSRSGTTTSREPACRSAASPSSPRLAATRRRRSTFTGSR